MPPASSACFDGSDTRHLFFTLLLFFLHLSGKGQGAVIMRRNRVTMSRGLGTSFGDRKPCPPDHEQKDGKKAQTVGGVMHGTRSNFK